MCKEIQKNENKRKYLKHFTQMSNTHNTFQINIFQVALAVYLDISQCFP